MARESKKTETYEFDRMGGFLGNTPEEDKPGYPSIGDQLDMLWHAIDSGDWTAAKVKTTEFYTALKAVKDAHPKP